MNIYGGGYFKGWLGGDMGGLPASGGADETEQK